MRDMNGSAALGQRRWRGLPAFLRGLLGVLLLLLLLMGGRPALAQTGGAADAEAQSDGVPLVVMNRRIYVFRASVFGLTAAQRARRAVERIDAQPARRLRGEIKIEPLTHDGETIYAIQLEGESLFALSQADLDVGGPPLPRVAEDVATRLRAALQARWEQGSRQRLLYGAAWTLAATVIMLAVLYALQAAGRFIDGRTLDLRISARARPLLDWRRVAVLVLARAVHWLKVGLMLVALYLWLAFVLTRFPYTEPWGRSLGDSLAAIITRVLTGIVHALPDLAMVALIFLVTHLTVRALNAMMNAARASGVRNAALQPDTIGATRRLSAIFIWLFGLVIAYPFLPGAQSDAFKGVSVFFGLLVTLGSSGVVSQVMGGFVLIYSRALRAGDWVQVGETEGRVMELGVLSTKLRTRQDVEVTMPNSIVVGSRIVNLSDTTDRKGLSLATKVTIGYDTPWRQVHAMLQMAAQRTEALHKTPAPVVRQLNLQDWYVEYELNAMMRYGAVKADVLTELHGHIQDVFNEFGVQIMSPNFVLQPAEPVLVPKENWHAAPAAAEDAPAARPARGPAKGS